VLDVLIVVYLIYLLYKLVKGTPAFNIFIGVVLLSLVYMVVDFLNMRLLSSVFGVFAVSGVLLFVIIFQPEVRRFLLLLGNNTQKGRMQFLNKIFGDDLDLLDDDEKLMIQRLRDSMSTLSRQKIGALIVLMPEMNDEVFSGSGVKLDAMISEQLIENIFQNKSPLHDGAVIISNNRIHSASVVLPVSKSTTINKSLGLRHRAALGVSETTNAAAYIVSEETGKISYAYKGKLYIGIDPKDLPILLEKHLADS